MRHDRGAALLEVLVALAILGTAGASLATGVREALAATERARRADAELREASALLDAVALWPREDLDRRLGERAQGAWRLTILRPAPAVYFVTLADSGGGREVLRTAIYRPEPPRAHD